MAPHCPLPIFHGRLPLLVTRMRPAGSGVIATGVAQTAGSYGFIRAISLFDQVNSEPYKILLHPRTNQFSKSSLHPRIIMSTRRHFMWRTKGPDNFVCGILPGPLSVVEPARLPPPSNEWDTPAVNSILAYFHTHQSVYIWFFYSNKRGPFFVQAG